MSPSRQQLVQDLLVFALLIAIGVTGRLAQPLWCVTPTAAVAILAGIYFSRLAIAAMVPVAILLLSDLFLPSYDSIPVMLATYGAMTFPLVLGRWVAGARGSWSNILRWTVSGVLPATVFFVVTNFAVWAFQSDYEKSLAGLAHCYWAAVPFYRWMLAGDVAYLGVLLACWSLAGVPVARRQLTPAVAATSQDERP